MTYDWHGWRPNYRPLEYECGIYCPQVTEREGEAMNDKNRKFHELIGNRIFTGKYDAIDWEDT